MLKNVNTLKNGRNIWESNLTGKPDEYKVGACSPDLVCFKKCPHVTVHGVYTGKHPPFFHDTTKGRYTMHVAMGNEDLVIIGVSNGYGSYWHELWG